MRNVMILNKNTNGSPKQNLKFKTLSIDITIGKDIEINIKINKIFKSFEQLLDVKTYPRYNFLATTMN